MTCLAGVYHLFSVYGPSMSEICPLHDQHMTRVWPVCDLDLSVGGATPLVFAYFSEFSPSEYRGRMISVVSYFWIIGNTLVAGWFQSVVSAINRWWQVGSVSR